MAASGTLREELQEVLASLVRSVIRPNLKLSEEKLALIREEAVAEVEPVLILKDQIIVRKGEIVSPEQVQILSDLGLLKRGPNYPLVLGMGFIILLLLGMLGVYLYQYLPSILKEKRLSPSSVWCLSSSPSWPRSSPYSLDRGRVSDPGCLRQDDDRPVG